MVAKRRYLGDGKRVYRVYSGLTLLNQFALSSQIPSIVEIVTNNETSRKRTVSIGKMKYVFRKSRFRIDKGNASHYTLLQLFSELGSASALTDDSKRRIRDYIAENDIQQRRLIQYAMEFPAQVMKNLLGSEVLHGAL